MSHVTTTAASLNPDTLPRAGEPGAPVTNTTTSPAPVAWMHPESHDVIHADRKAIWARDYGEGGAKKAAAYSVPLYVADPTVANELWALLSAARYWIACHDHGENCHLSDHYDGDPGNQCSCGKDWLLGAVGDALSERALSGEPR